MKEKSFPLVQCQIKRGVTAVIPVEVVPHEIDILIAVHGHEHVVIGNKSRYSVSLIDDAAAEYQRLQAKYDSVKAKNVAKVYRDPLELAEKAGLSTDGGVGMNAPGASEIVHEPEPAPAKADKKAA